MSTSGYWRMGMLALSLVAGPAAAQGAESLDAFLARLAPVLRTPKAPARIVSFSAKVLVDARSALDDPKGPARARADVDAEIDYHEPRFLKTRITESGSEIVRGIEERAPWMMQDGRSYWISGKEYKQDKDAIYRDLAVARAMTRYLYPDRELRRLADVTGPIAETIFWTREESARPCYRITGIATDGADYPLATAPERNGPVRVTAWFAKDTLYPIAIRLEPIEDRESGKPAGRAEELRFLAHRVCDELLLPTRIVFRVADDKTGKMKVLQEVQIERFQANPAQLVPASFRRPGS